MPALVGIAGASGSGKTTIAESLQAKLQALGKRVYVLPEDAYYNAHPTDWDYDRRAACNYDVPESKDFGLLAQHLADLTAGKTITHPTYDFVVHNRAAVTVTLNPADFDVIILEGILCFCDAAVCAALQLKIFVETPLDECLARRIERDVTERGRDVKGILAQYRAQVRPAFYDYILPSQAQADVTVRGDGVLGDVVDGLVGRVLKV